MGYLQTLTNSQVELAAEVIRYRQIRDELNGIATSILCDRSRQHDIEVDNALLRLCSIDMVRIREELK